MSLKVVMEALQRLNQEWAKRAKGAGEGLRAKGKEQKAEGRRAGGRKQKARRQKVEGYGINEA